jgi:hypothetical protein
MIGTYTGLWRIIDWWNHRSVMLARRRERAEARARELATARERIARDQSASAFDRRIVIRRKGGG